MFFCNQNLVEENKTDVIMIRKTSVEEGKEVGLIVNIEKTESTTVTRARIGDSFYILTACDAYRVITSMTVVNISIWVFL